MANNDCGIYELHCKAQFESIHRKLDNLDTTLNGNGRPGIKMETDRNTRWISGVVKALWVIATAVIGIIAWIIRGQLA